jgi:hypothetical protein
MLYINSVGRNKPSLQREPTMSGYNGWKNWDTWHVSLNFGESLLDIANEAGADMEPDTAEELVAEWIGTAGNDYAQWLINSHLGQVDWREIVKHINDDREKSEEEEAE